MIGIYEIGGIITWLIILFAVWHDYETEKKSINTIWDVVFIGGFFGGVLGLIWPITWGAVGMMYLSRLLYKGYYYFGFDDLMKRNHS